MAKQKTSLKYIYKINSSRIRKDNWNLQIDKQKARKNEEIVSLADSATLRFIGEIEGKVVSEVEAKVKSTKKMIRILKKQDNNEKNRGLIKNLYLELDNLLFVDGYVCIIMDTIKDFDVLNKGFYINDVKFKRLLATTGGAKNSTVVYVKESVYEKLHKRIENGRDTKIKLVAGKLEAYKALTCSVSISMQNKPRGVLVVKDCITKFTANVIEIDDTHKDTIYPTMKNLKDFPIELNESDGYGLISPSLALQWSEELGLDYIPCGFCIRNSFTKGMLFVFDFHLWANVIAEENSVIDIWKNKQNILESDIVLTGSMLKLWESYRDIEHYMDCCEENGYSFSVNKVYPKELDNERSTNYQFIQSLNLSENNIDNLIKPTIDEIHDVLGGDINKTLLFLKGIEVKEENFDVGDSDFTKALMIDERMIRDPFVRSKIHNMIKKQIDEAKTGVLKIRGNWSVVSGDPYSLCQSIFNKEVTGLLNEGEFYSKYWNDRNVSEVACFRAPMTCHNNIRKLNLVNSNEIKFWYQYMNTCTIFNSHDTTAHALNGLDKDADTVLTTDNKIILDSIEQLDAIVCVQKPTEKKVVKEKDLIKANKNSFGDAIGTITNRITGMFDVRSKFDKDSEEYKELDYRIRCGQNFQQNAIDKTKGIISKPMPKEWYSYKVNKVLETDSEEVKTKKEFNLRILANKKPYFFNYIYPENMKEYKKFVSQMDENSLRRYGLTIDELRIKIDKNSEEIEFIDYYDSRLPAFIHDSVMHRICKKIEASFYRKVSQKPKFLKFDHSILKSDAEYDKETYIAIEYLYEQYKEFVKNYSQNSKRKRISKEDKSNNLSLFKETFKRMATELCNNEEELCNVIVDVCYSNNSSKQFAWDAVGDTIIKNLLIKNNYIIKYPEQDEKGDINFGGKTFSMISMSVNKSEEKIE